MQQQSPKFPRQYIIVAYQMKDDTVELVETAKDTFTLNFSYRSPTELMCSLFTFVEESFNVDTYTTENLVIDKNKGGEQHLTLPATGEKDAPGSIPKVTVKVDQKYFFTDTIQNNYYPMLIRLVDYLSHRKARLLQAAKRSLS